MSEEHFSVDGQSRRGGRRVRLRRSAGIRSCDRQAQIGRTKLIEQQVGIGSGPGRTIWLRQLRLLGRSRWSHSAQCLIQPSRVEGCRQQMSRTYRVSRRQRGCSVTGTIRHSKVTDIAIHHGQITHAAAVVAASWISSRRMVTLPGTGTRVPPPGLSG